ncbi:MAG: glycosyltransferase [Rhizomicrobium sp.]
MPNKPPRVAICFPSADTVQADFALALSGVCLATRGVELVVINPKSSIVAVARNNGVERAQQREADYILFLDSDMIFPADTLMRLLAHKKDIVGALYTKRLPPYEILGTPLPDATPDANGLVEMKRLPTGCLMIAMDVFTKLPEPYFHFGINPETHKLLGEDYAFCDDARFAGFSLWADMKLSQELGHIGQHICRVPTAQP